MVKPVDQLTKDESFAICLNAGVQIKHIYSTSDGDDFMIKLVLEPATIRIENGRYVVAVRRDRSG